MIADREWAMGLYDLLGRGGAEEALFYLEIPGAPWSKSRPRFARGRTYAPRDDVAAERATKTRLLMAKPTVFAGNVMLACRFYRPNFQRIDADNLLKHVCDSANGVLWADDSQVTLVLAEVHHDASNPRTILLAANHSSTMKRGVDGERECIHCGSKFMPAFNASKKRFCTTACNHAARTTKLVEIPCAQCAKQFKPTTKEQILCGRECSVVYMRGRQQRSRQEPSKCGECGTHLAHRRGGRCRDCWRKSPAMFQKESP